MMLNLTEMNSMWYAIKIFSIAMDTWCYFVDIVDKWTNQSGYTNSNVTIIYTFLIANHAF